MWLGLMPLAAQSVTITKDFAQVPMASVLAMYKNEFGSYEKPDMTDTFPYAVIRMHLEGSGQAVREAKERLTLYMGQQMGVERRVTTYSNQILFLVRSRHPMIYIDCGDGCERVLLSNMQQLKSNCVYDCTVRYEPEEEYVAHVTTQAPKRQFFKFRVTPADAIVEVDVNGQKDMWPVSDGVASKPLNYGLYRYTISANRYHTESGEFVVSDTETEKTVSLRPKFGYLYITSNVAQGAYVYATNLLTGARQSLGTVPVNGKDLDSGTYSILIQKDKYKDYTATITIDEGKTTMLNPTLEANFVQLTLTTSAQSDMYINGQKLGTGRWTGTLELGEHSVETRQASHQSAYTTLRVTSQCAGQTFALNNPIPIYGSMTLTSTPSDAVVYVDGKKVGTSPMIVNELLVGTHRIRLEKDGYDNLEKTVQIAENQESVLDFTLIKTIASAHIAEVPIASAMLQSGSVGYDYVDLGLSVKWATCNIGASKPEDYGDYFTWGETQPKSIYNWGTYKWCRGTKETQTKYNNQSSYGTLDNKTQLDYSDDAACTNWGGSWRMPTKAEQDELREQCTWTWTTQNGVKGYKVTSKKNGNSIFLPAAGFRYNSLLNNAGSNGYYWSNSLDTDSPDRAYYLNFYSSFVGRYYRNRLYGHSVRPVCP